MEGCDSVAWQLVGRGLSSPDFVSARGLGLGSSQGFVPDIGGKKKGLHVGAIKILTQIFWPLVSDTSNTPQTV